MLLSVNHNEKRYEIIVEDKVHSSEHDNQLSRYKTAVNDANSDAIIICIY